MKKRVPFIPSPLVAETPVGVAPAPAGGFSPLLWLAAGALLLFVITAESDEEIEELRANPKPIVTNEQLQNRLRVWQKRLHLEDWNVRARMARAWELGPDLADIDIRSERRRAAIRILDPRDYDLPKNEIAADVELSLVHELTHLQLAALPLPQNRSSRAAEERVVRKLSRALVRNPRAAKPAPGSAEPPAGRISTNPEKTVTP